MSRQSLSSVVSLLKRFLQVYWLKPFDAVNDTANAWALRQFPWEEPILEIGGGDGVFSFIMHGGELIPADDRYDQSAPGRSGDIFDVYDKDLPLTIKRRAARKYLATVDLKRSHLRKCKETQLYRLQVASPPEPLPFAGGVFKTVFLYFPHGMAERDEVLDYGRILMEIRRVIRADGALLMTAMNRRIADCFVCYPLHRFFERSGWPRLSAYFKRLDSGRYQEISGAGYTLERWMSLLNDAGFCLTDGWAQVTPLAWRVYDFQTRPILRPLIRWSWLLRRAHLKKAVKAIWVYVWLPVLTLFYIVFAKPGRFSVGLKSRSAVFFVFRAIPT